MSITVSFPELLKDGSREEFELATNLKVAYKVQGYHNHKPYLQIFVELDKMLIEQQIAIVYAALVSADPAIAKEVTKTYFEDYMLERYNVKELMNLVAEIVQGIMGMTADDVKPTEQSEGN